MKFVPNAISSKAALAVLKTQKHSPKLLFAGGVVGVVGTVVLASRATLKVDEVLTATNDKLSDIRSLDGDERYSAEDAQKDKAIVYAHAALAIGKLYAPAVGLGVLSIGMLAGSNHILTKRNAALTAAYAAVDKGFREYRERVASEFGEEKDKEFLYGVETKTHVHTDKNGKKVKTETKVATKVSDYGRLFHEGNPNWNRTPEYNFLFLRGIQQMANDQLRSRGFLLLNDVYDDLGLERTQAGCVVGWLADGDGDGYVDFGIFDDASALRIYDYVTGREGELYLDFNVDGIIYDKI